MKHFFSWMRSGPVALLVLLWLAGPAARAQAPAWQSVVAASGNATSVRGMAADAAGNVYITGNFTGMVSFDGIVLTEAGGADVFVAKWNTATRRFVWALRAGGASSDQSYSLALSGSSVYIAGAFNGTASFGSTVLNTSGGTQEVFVAKLTDAGPSASFTWAKQAGGINSDCAYGVAVNGSSVYVAGIFFSITASFGSITLANHSSTSYDAFLTRLTDAGPSASFDWAQRIGGTGEDYANAVAVSGSSVYVAGTFNSRTVSFGSANSGILSNPLSSDDIFVARFTDSGGFDWSRRAGGIGADRAYALAATGSSVYLAGDFDSPSAGFGNFRLATTGDDDGYVAKLTDNGSSTDFNWVQPVTGAGAASVKAIAVSGTRVMVAGSFNATATFGSTTLANVVSTGTTDVFVAKLLDADSTGTFAWARQAGGASGDDAYSVAISGPNVYAAGTALPPATFGSQLLTSTATVFQLGFLASLTDPTLLAITTAQSSLPFSLYPNPARAATTVLLPALPGTATATLTLRDALGRALRTATVALPAAGLRHELDLTNLPAGIYAVQVQAGAATATRRLVVE